MRYFRPQSNNFVIFDDFFVYHRNPKISDDFRFMIKSFERQKQQDIAQDQLKKKNKTKPLQEVKPVQEVKQAPPPPTDKAPE